MRTPAGQRRQDPATLPEPGLPGEAPASPAHKHRHAPRRRGGAPRRPPAARPTRAGSIARGLTGSLAVGLLVLAATLGGVQWWASAQGFFGPGVGFVIGHFVASGAALALQAVADRRRDVTGGLASLGVLVVVLGALTYWWWT